MLRVLLERDGDMSHWYTKKEKKHPDAARWYWHADTPFNGRPVYLLDTVDMLAPARNMPIIAFPTFDFEEDGVGIHEDHSVMIVMVSDWDKLRDINELTPCDIKHARELVDEHKLMESYIASGFGMPVAEPMSDEQIKVLMGTEEKVLGKDELSRNG